MRVYYHYAKGSIRGAVLDSGRPDSHDVSFIIVDGTNPTLLADLPHVPSLLISSPRGQGQDIYGEYTKDGTWLYMPMPSEDEIMLMRDSCFDGDEGIAGTQVVVSERISRWGAVPRYTLFNVDGEDEVLDRAIADAKHDDVVAVLKEGSLEDASMKLSFRLVHYDVDASLTKVRYRWASTYVKNQLITMLRRGDAAARLTYMKTCMESPRPGELSGILFEAFACERMTLGGAFRVKRLCLPKCINDTLPSADGTGAVAAGGAGASASEATARADAVATPKLLALEDDFGVSWLPDGTGKLKVNDSDVTRELASKVVPTLERENGRLPHRAQFATGTAAADFVELCGVPSNATVSSQHDIVVLGSRNSNGLYPVRTHLYSGGARMPDVQPLFWLVPPAAFAAMKAGKLVINPMPTKERTPEEEVARATLEAAARSLEVVQYAVEIQAPTDEETARGSLARSVVGATVEAIVRV